ncbi:unnamed protein product [Zymoseptoria tritici ST99CH_3D7]|uniref:Hydrophobin n=1 Tax=Zymoseptoria tritici (strain ST99CH_3D7) TaxID=1276538 RepID=A0A1X7RIL6_ZYMT9|nr:unnamed protein product [Zymoseptoria tritici ST99CH_3D7]
MKLTTFSMALIAASIDLAMATNDICCVNTRDPSQGTCATRTPCCGRTSFLAATLRFELTHAPPVRWQNPQRTQTRDRYAEPLLFSLRASSVVRSRVEDTLLNALLKVNRANRSVSPNSQRTGDKAAKEMKDFLKEESKSHGRSSTLDGLCAEARLRDCNENNPCRFSLAIADNAAVAASVHLQVPSSLLRVNRPVFICSLAQSASLYRTNGPCKFYCADARQVRTRAVFLL